jgi:uncharacterized membrane protein HdeD (DUF308 family)
MTIRRNTQVSTSADDDVSVVNKVTVSDQTFDVSRLASLLAGAYLVVLGALVLLDSGLNDFPDLPLSSTFGFTQTPLLGAINVGIGLLLLLGAAGWERGITTFVSSVMAIGGLIILLGVDRLPTALTTNTGYGAMLLVVGGVLLLIATVIPAVRSQRRVGHTSAH